MKNENYISMDSIETFGWNIQYEYICLLFTFVSCTF